MKYKLHLVTLCYNEIDILPYCLDYWRRLGVDKAVVWDNYSDDGSYEYLSEIPWIEVRRFQSDGHNDIIHQQIKHQAFREEKEKGECDFLYLCDIDEWLWCKNMYVFDDTLDLMMYKGNNVLCNPWYALCGDKSPEQTMKEYVQGKYLHQILQRGYKQYINHTLGYGDWGKFLLINMRATDDITFSVGQHILYGIRPHFKPYYSQDIITFHLNKGFSEEHFVVKRVKMARRLSDTNVRFGMGVEYFTPEEKARQEYRNNVTNSIDVSEL